MKKHLLALLTLLVMPVVAYAQTTDTSTTSLEEVLGVIPGIVAAFNDMGILAGIAAVAGAALVVLNFGPLKKALAASPLDYVRPLIMLISVSVAAGIGTAMAGASALSAVIAGVMAGLGSGWLQKLIQEWRD